MDQNLLGEPIFAIEQFERAARLSPLDPLFFIVQNGIVAAHFFAGRYEEALSLAERPKAESQLYVGIMMLAVSAALAGREQEMHKAIGRLRDVDPKSRMSNFKNWIPLRRPEDAATFDKGLRLTGLPE